MSVEIVNSPPGRLAILSVSPHQEDHLCLRRIVDQSKWVLFEASDLLYALALLQQHDIAVILCERDLEPGSWIDLLEQMRTLEARATLIVTSRLADDSLWSMILNRGAWDLLAKPYDRLELVRSVKSAWEHWRHQFDATLKPMKTMEAAS